MKLSRICKRFRIDRPGKFRLADFDPADTCGLDIEKAPDTGTPPSGTGPWSPEAASNGGTEPSSSTLSSPQPHRYRRTSRTGPPTR